MIGQAAPDDAFGGVVAEDVRVRLHPGTVENENRFAERRALLQHHHRVERQAWGAGGIDLQGRAIPAGSPPRPCRRDGPAEPAVEGDQQLRDHDQREQECDRSLCLRFRRDLRAASGGRGQHLEVFGTGTGAHGTKLVEAGIQFGLQHRVRAAVVRAVVGTGREFGTETRDDSVEIRDARFECGAVPGALSLVERSNDHLSEPVRFLLGPVACRHREQCRRRSVVHPDVAGQRSRILTDLRRDGGHHAGILRQRDVGSDQLPERRVRARHRCAAANLHHDGRLVDAGSAVADEEHRECHHRRRDGRRKRDPRQFASVPEEIDGRRDAEFTTQLGVADVSFKHVADPFAELPYGGKCRF